MKIFSNIILFLSLTIVTISCSTENETRKGLNLSAEQILGNPDYLAMSYGGYRQNTRDIVPTVDELKDDMKILSAMGIKLLRTYNTQQYAHAANLLEAIKQLKDENPEFEMYVMLGTWIECKDAWTATADHSLGNIENNTSEIKAAVDMANTYPDIVKMIAVGNEAMVQWAIKYFVYPNVILKWVDYLKDLRNKGEIPKDIWITSSDNYESWGGGSRVYKTDDLAALIKSVDFVSLHTYPFHDSHYNPAFWGVPKEEEKLSKLEQIDAAMLRSKEYAISQYQAAADYMSSLGVHKPIHIGETGWASVASSSYGATGSRAADEYKEKLYYEHMRDWTNNAGMSCFYFEAFDEQWKDQGDPLGSENHFGLIKLNNEAKYALWEMLDEGAFEGLTRNGLSICKTYNGDENRLIEEVLTPPLMSEMGLLEITSINENRKVGDVVTEGTYVVVHNNLKPNDDNDITYSSTIVKLNAWEGTCGIEMTQEGVIEVVSGTGAWWGCALEVSGGEGENLSGFKSGYLHFDIKGNTKSSFHLGFQTGSFALGTQTNNQVLIGPNTKYEISDGWQSYSIRIDELDQNAQLEDVTALLFLRGDKNFDGKRIYIKNLYFTKE